ncbi:MAG: bifunctional riboflavin kinase/FAD synthetase [Agromyces sp.]
MRVFHGARSVPTDFGPSAVAIGKFDGVHAGHRVVLDELQARARDASPSLSTVAVTFDRHPLAVLDPASCPEPLTGASQKLELLGETGIDACVVVEFTPEFAATEPEQFVRDVLVDALQARLVLVGADFRFGVDGRGGVGLLHELGQQFGFELVVISDVLRSHSRASSTRVRELLTSGEVADAAEVLGHLPAIRGEVVHGAARGRELGFPTANLSAESEGFVPADGVYAGWLWDGGVRYPAAISVGNNPTFEGVPQRQVEAYVIDETLDLYGHVVDVEFAHRIRGMAAFDSIDALIAQMTDDVRQATRLLA